jgi:hypothetical protein
MAEIKITITPSQSDLYLNTLKIPVDGLARAVDHLKAITSNIAVWIDLGEIREELEDLKRQIEEAHND